jgi:hypothetical protein
VYTNQASPKPAKRRVYKASDDMRVVAHIQRELEGLPRYAQAKVMGWVNRSMEDGTIQAMVIEERQDQPPLPMTPLVTASIGPDAQVFQAIPGV